MANSHTRPHLVRTALVVLGFAIMAAAPLVGIIPGPGGILVFALGLVLVLKNATWARRAFARLKRRWPRFGHYSDLALRRRSFRRRQQREKEAAMAKAESELLGFPADSR